MCQPMCSYAGGEERGTESWLCFVATLRPETSAALAAAAAACHGVVNEAATPTAARRASAPTP